MARLNSIFHQKARRCGFTLVEIFVAACLSIVIVGGLMTTFVFVVRSFRAIQNYSSLNAASRHTLDVLSRDVRSAARVAYATTNTLSLTNYDNVSGYMYQWDPTVGTFTRYYTNTSGTVATNVLLTGCDTLGFLYYIQVPGANLTFTQTINLNEVKLIDVSWKCSRQIYGFKINTESVQTARIVRRN